MIEMMDILKRLARRYHSRWSKLDDALSLIRLAEDGGRSKKGEQSRRLLDNPFRVTTYPDKAKAAAKADRAIALSKLQKPLAEALGHIVAIEAADAMIQEIEQCEADRDAERREASRIERRSIYSPLLEALHDRGVNRGHWSALSPSELAAIAQFIRRKAEAREALLPPLRSASQTRERPGERRHMFWNAHPLHDRAGKEG